MAGEKPDYNRTITACFAGYVVQAVVNNFAPLLFLTFQTTYGVPLEKITLLVTFNFGVQLAVDLASVAFVDRVGYRASLVAAHLFAAAGLALLAVLPNVWADPFAGLLVAVTVYAVGGGLLEVLVSPVVEACPSANKEAAMSMLHSFYCWGHVGVVLLSTVFFWLFGTGAWPVLALAWAALPLVNGLVFTRVPLAPVLPEGERGLGVAELARSGVFWVLVLMMVCAGASEQAVSQWASTFAELGLGVSKTAGDLAGPLSFAVLMGASRAFYGAFGEKVDLDRFMGASCVLCVAAYLLVVFAPWAPLSLAGCALCGLSVGIMWPGTFSKAAAALPAGGTALYALLALGGDVGCSAGPTLVGLVSGAAGGVLKQGILAAVVFPVLLLCGAALCRRLSSRRG